MMSTPECSHTVIDEPRLCLHQGPAEEIPVIDPWTSQCFGSKLIPEFQWGHGRRFE